MGIFFKEFTSGSRKPGHKIWIHASGNIAAVLDASRSSNGSELVAEITSLWDGKESLTAHEALQIAQDSFGNKLDDINLSVFQRESDHVVVASIGYLQTILLARSASIQAPTYRLDLKPSEYFIVSTSQVFGLNGINSRTFESARTEMELSSVGRQLATSDDWAMLAFPFESSLSYVDPAWKYNPFSGSQEERDREKKGLARIANNLFKDESFDGFRIVGGQFYQHRDSSSMPDGILVSPWGLFVLELKDHFGSIVIPENSQNTVMTISLGHGKPQRSEKNPVAQLMGSLRSNFQKFEWGVSLPANARAYGLLVFTNPQATVNTVDHESKKHALPRDLGDVIVCTPNTIAAAIKSKMQRFMSRSSTTAENQSELAAKLAAATGKTVASSRRAVITDRDIGAIVSHLTRQVPVGVSTEAIRQHGRFTFGPHALEAESNNYYKVYLGNVQGKDRKIWVKEYPMTAMERGDGLETEIDRLRRELTASQDLPVSPHIQRGLDSWDEPGCLFVALDYVAGQKLDEWLRDKQPSRETRLKLLLEISKTLGILASENIVHRALTPANIRIDQTGLHVIINLELCRLPNSATIAQNARALLDTQYQSPEVLVAGRQVGPSADAYSFGKLACLILSQDISLPFSSPADQQKKMAKAGFWASVSSHCGFAADSENSFQCILALDPSRRPTGDNLVSLVEDWQ
ncbi:protein kinase domain-containing protein [Propionivibrio sp.]|uniref:protein kinase domain-containing protein n=1 Tax=Propionivibrio sp. TaxID=2212460 RepID=UPI003BF05BA0